MGEILAVSRERTPEATQTYVLTDPVTGLISGEAYATDFSLDVSVRTSGAADLHLRFILDPASSSPYTTCCVLDAGSGDVLSQQPAAEVSGTTAVTIPTTTSEVIVQLRPAPEMDWTTLPAATGMSCESWWGSTGPLQVVTGLVVCPREPSVPDLRVVSPDASSIATATLPVTFEVHVWDLVDGDLPAGVARFESDRQGFLGTSPVAVTTLEVGIHNVVVSAENSAGLTGSELLVVDVRAPTPQVTITAPTTATTIEFPGTLELEATASDATGHAYQDAEYTWTSSVDGVSGSGPSLTLTPSVGSHYWSVVVTNSLGGRGEARLQVEVTAPSPNVSIQSPSTGFFHVLGQPLALTGTVSMPDESPVTQTDVIWASDKTGELATGATTSTTSLTPGRHQLGLIAQSSYATTGSAQVGGVTVPPTTGVLIVSPEPGASYETGFPIFLEGLGSDPILGLFSEGTASWVSDLNGQLTSASSLTCTTALTDGMHTLTYQISDFADNPCTATVTITVAKRRPIVQLLYPPNQGAYPAGASLPLQGTGFDPLEGELAPAAFAWSDGPSPLGTGPTLPVTLTEGQHLLTLAAVGPAGGTTASTVSVTVTTLPVTGDVSLAGQVRTTDGEPLDGATVEVLEVATGRTRSCSTPVEFGAGSYGLGFPSAIKTTGPAEWTTYEFHIYSEGSLRESIPATLIVTPGATGDGPLVQDLLVP